MTKTLFLIGWLAASTLIAGSALRGQEAAAKSEPDDPYEIPEAARERRNPVLRSDLALRNAQTLWQKHCETCHGASGRGDGPNARLHEQRKGHAPRNLTNPKVQQNLTDGDIGGARGSLVFINRVGPDGMMIVPVGQKERETILSESQSLTERVERAIGYQTAR